VVTWYPPGMLARSRPVASLQLRGIVAIVGSLAAAVGCSSKPAEAPKPELSVEETLAKFMRREHGPFEKHSLQLAGLGTASAEAKTPPKVECAKKGNERHCQVVLDMGPDEDGDPAAINCAVTTQLGPFGLAVHHGVGASQLAETPQLTVEKIGQGVAATFVVNMVAETETTVNIGTLKLARLYAQGHMAECRDSMAGGRETFHRVVNDFFASLKLEENRAEPFRFGIAYRMRKGKKTLGLRYIYLIENTEDPGFVEYGVFFHLAADEKNWQTLDIAHAVVRDDKGELTRYGVLHWPHGQGPLSLVAKPTEAGKFRVKRVLGTSSDAIELTPKAGLSTELWSAPELRRLATGELESYSYGFPALDGDRDPSFAYSMFSPSGPGVVDEKAVPHAKMKDGADEGESHELHVDERGIVTKQVDATLLTELIVSSGALPELLSR